MCLQVIINRQCICQPGIQGCLLCVDQLCNGNKALLVVIPDQCVIVPGIVRSNFTEPNIGRCIQELERPASNGQFKVQIQLLSGVIELLQLQVGFFDIGFSVKPLKKGVVER